MTTTLVGAIALAQLMGAIPLPPGEWGPFEGGLCCRLHSHKQICPVGEPIWLELRIRSVTTPHDEAAVSQRLRDEKPGLISSLKVLGPDGRLLQPTGRPDKPPAGRLATRFEVSRYFDFSRPGTYCIVAQWPLDGLDEPVHFQIEQQQRPTLRSQTLELSVVPVDFITIAIRPGADVYDLKGPIPLIVELATGQDRSLAVADLRIEFRLGSEMPGRYWSCPLDPKPFPRRLLLKQTAAFTFDLATTGWNPVEASSWPHQPLANLVGPGDRLLLAVSLSGTVSGQRFAVAAKPLAIQFAKP